MKSIYISFPIRGHGDDYGQRLDEAVEYVKTNYPDYDEIITPKEIAKRLEDMLPMKPTYKEYLLANMKEISRCDSILMYSGWYDSNECLAEWSFSEAIGLTILYQNR